MRKGSTPAPAAGHLRPIRQTVADDIPNTAKCIHRPDPVDDLTVCPACWPSSYARRHARHRRTVDQLVHGGVELTPSYMTTQIQPVTR